MFDLGMQELIVIFVVALLVFGPKKLPELARNMGKTVGHLKKVLFDVKNEIDREMNLGEASVNAHMPDWQKENLKRTGMIEPDDSKPEDQLNNSEELNDIGQGLPKSDDFKDDINSALKNNNPEATDEETSGYEGSTEGVYEEQPEDMLEAEPENTPDNSINRDDTAQSDTTFGDKS